MPVHWTLNRVGEHAEDDIAAIGGGRPGSAAGKRPATRDGFTSQATKDDKKVLMADGMQQTEETRDILGEWW